MVPICTGNSTHYIFHYMIKVVRSDFSSYLDHQFAQQEKLTLTSLPNISYSTDPKTECDIFLSNSNTDFSHINYQNLKLIIHPNSGYDNFPLELVRNANYPIILGNPIRSRAVTSYIMQCLLSHFCALPRQNTWNRSLGQQNLTQKNMLLIGLGQIGQLVKQSTTPLLKKIFCYDPFKFPQQQLGQIPLGKCHIVVIAASLNPTNLGMIDEHFLSSLPSDVVLINAARGGFVKLPALINFLKKNSSAFAYLDVFEPEPFDLASLQTLKNLHTTSHLAGVFTGLDRAIIEYEYQVLNDFLQLRPKQFNDKYNSLMLQNRLHKDFLI